MKIAYLSSFYPFRGGIAQFNALLLQAFQEIELNAKAYTFTTQYPNILFPGKTQMVSENDSTAII
ncbi:MAG: glycosyl transferase, partial [Bacteroidales bacterium]|nr:glycosyl transferase [Bacteroidales bacterium]